MSGTNLVSPPRSWVVHSDPGGGLTSCGCYVTDKWVVLAQHGSLHSVTCQRCLQAMVAVGDLGEGDMPGFMRLPVRKDGTPRVPDLPISHPEPHSEYEAWGPVFP